MGAQIESGAIKIVEVIGISGESFEDAVQQAVTKASKSINGISGVEVMRHSCRVVDGKVTQYKANLKLAFAVK